MDCGARDGGYSKHEAAEPHRTRDPGGVVDVIPVEAAGDDTGDEGSLMVALVECR